VNALADADDRREPFADDPAAERDRQLDNLALGYRLFAALGWGDTGDGHITFRDPDRADHMWLLRHGVSFDRATAVDMVRTGPDGSSTDRAGRPATINMSAYYIHHPIHQARPDVGAAAHTHTQWGTPLAAERRMIEPITQESTVFFEDVALFDDEAVQVIDTDGGKRIAAALGDKTSAILANHGLLTTGASVAAAVGLFVMMERAAEAHMKVREPRPISAEAARIARADLTAHDLGWNVFRWLTRRHLGVA
jgi:ribulose-5-phosphate 4-epimerase/fuculose-1-phosphate aldolase